MLANYLLIGAGGFLGTLARALLSSAIASRVGETFPWGTLLVNVSGCFFIGLFAALTGPEGRYIVSPNLRQFVMIGFCGGYTTFSSFSLQTLSLVRDGDVLRGGANVALSTFTCLVAVWLGFAAATAVNRLKGS